MSKKTPKNCTLLRQQNLDEAMLEDGIEQIEDNLQKGHIDLDAEAQMKSSNDEQPKAKFKKQQFLARDYVITHHKSLKDDDIESKWCIKLQEVDQHVLALEMLNMKNEMLQLEQDIIYLSNKFRISKTFLNAKYFKQF